MDVLMKTKHGLLAHLYLIILRINGIILIIIHKKEFFLQKWRIIDSEGGEIQNEKFQFNGMTYLRRSVEKSEEIIEESICIKWI